MQVIILLIYKHYWYTAQKPLNNALKAVSIMILIAIDVKDFYRIKLYETFLSLLATYIRLLTCRAAIFFTKAVFNNKIEVS